MRYTESPQRKTNIKIFFILNYLLFVRFLHPDVFYRDYLIFSFVHRQAVRHGLLFSAYL